MSDLIYLRGTPKELRPVITALMAQYQLLQNLDVDSSSGYDSQIDSSRRFRPFVRLFFREDSDFRKGTNQPGYHGKNRTKGRIGFRLMNETTETISKTELTRIGQRIKDLFGSNDGYIWNKGKELYCYAEWDKGYQLQILARNVAHAKEIVTKTLSIQGHTPQWKFLSKTENQAEAERYPITPGTKIILGETITLPEVRPKADVRFKYADVIVSPLLSPTVLYDRTNKKAGALVKN